MIFFGGGEKTFIIQIGKSARASSGIQIKMNTNLTFYICPRFWLGPALSESWQPSHTRILQAYFINIICPIFLVEKIRNLTCRLEYRVSYTELMRMKG